MAKPFLRVRLDKPKPAAKAMPKPKPAAKLKATPAAETAIARGNRSQAMEAKENRMMNVGKRKAPQTISITVRERTTPMKKK